MKDPSPEVLSVADELNYLVGFNNLYVGHLSSLFNFFIVFTALVLNALAFVIKPSSGFPPTTAQAIIAFSLIVACLFFALDYRTRQIVNHIEKSILCIEENSMQASARYLRGAPKPVLFSVVRHSVVFPLIYICFLLLMIAFLCFV